ncbi:MAG: M20/M25/M40 family metallo-hydrolase, partial [Betaproteobacteria bacterium]
IIGMASHAGTTPMDARRDAATAAAELALYVEKRGAGAPSLVATVGVLEVPNGSINVVPGCCNFSLDIRATSDDLRDDCASDVCAELVRVCARRGLHFKLEQTMRVAAAASAPVWQQRWEQALVSLGVPIHRMPSGAGHDAMKLHEIMPQAMLFVRGQNAGISHNPLESVNNDDVQVAVDAFSSLMQQLAVEWLQSEASGRKPH